MDHISKALIEALNLIMKELQKEIDTEPGSERSLQLAKRLEELVALINRIKMGSDI